MLSYVDADNNKPLHTAVQFGNVYAVQVCLEYGASVGEVNEANKNTAVHTACTQGSLEILRLMQQKQPKEFAESLSTDVSKIFNIVLIFSLSIIYQNPVTSKRKIIGKVRKP